VKRNGEEKTLSGQLFKGYVDAKNYVGPLPNPSKEQVDRLNKLIKN
jgi:hypothetical protein